MMVCSSGFFYIQHTYLKKETCIYDGKLIGMGGEDSMPAAAEMSTGEQIRELYGQLEHLRARLESIYRREMNEDLVPELIGGGEHFLIKQVERRDGVAVSGQNGTPCHDRGAVDSRQMVDRLPPEILMHIFELCLEDDEESVDDGAGFQRPSVRRAPLLLCRVCRYWKEAAEGTSALWRSISLVVDKRMTHVDGLKRMMDVWLRNSKSKAMAMNLEVDDAARKTIDGVLLGRLRDMVRQSHRLRINVDDGMLCELLDGDLEKLRTLEIRTSWLRRDAEGLRVRARALQTVAILGPAMCRFGEDALPWGQLREYRGVCWSSMQRHLDVVARCPALETCTVYAFCEPRRRAPALRVAGIRRLHVASYLVSGIGGLLESVEAPALEELTLEITQESPAFGHGAWPREAVADLLARSGGRGRLEELAVVGLV
jgi:hypothetical protein